MKNTGFIKLYRSFLCWQWYTDIPVKTLFIHILLSANYSSFNFKAKTYPPGTFITSYASLAEKTGLSVQMVRTAIKKLIKGGEISFFSTNKFIVINIVKWHVFQAVVHLPQQLNNNQSTTYKEYKNKRKNTSYFMQKNKKSQTFHNTTLDFDLFEKMLNEDD